MKRNRIVDILSAETTGNRITVMGWVRTRRDSKGGFSFFEINDGSCLNNLQVIVNDKLENYDTEVRKLQTGCSIRVVGTLVASPAKGQSIELQAEEVEVYGWTDPAYATGSERLDEPPP